MATCLQDTPLGFRFQDLCHRSLPYPVYHTNIVRQCNTTRPVVGEHKSRLFFSLFEFFLLSLALVDRRTGGNRWNASNQLGGEGRRVIYRNRECVSASSFSDDSYVCAARRYLKLCVPTRYSSLLRAKASVKAPAESCRNNLSHYRHRRRQTCRQV